MTNKHEMKMSTHVECAITQTAHRLAMTQADLRHLSLNTLGRAYHRLTDDEALVLLATLEERL